MPENPEEFIEIARRVADGEPIDWSGFARREDCADSLVADLRSLALVAAYFRRQTRYPDGPQLRAGDRWKHLEILERIGAGGFGEIFKARDAQLDRIVALKVIRPERIGLEGQKEQIIQEGRLQARVRHPNIAAVYGADESKGVIGLWMEFIKGRTLAEILRTQGTLGAAEAAVIGVDLCRALAAIHAVGVIHRDVKAENVMREDGGRIVLMDLGIGVEQVSSPDRLAGTPHYMAPELLEGAAASIRTDIYSLGVLLFHLVSGSFPVQAESFGELFEAHAGGVRRLLADVRPGLPRWFTEAVEIAASPNPDDRFSTVGEVERALTRSSAVHRTAAMPGTVTIMQRPSRYRWLIAAGLLAVFLGFAGWNSMTRLFLDPFRSASQTAAGRSVTDALAQRSSASIAVLPFRNHSGLDEHIVRGVAEHLTQSLSGVAGLKVIAPASSFQFTDPSMSTAVISDRLQVQYILRGTLEEQSGSFVATAELYDGSIPGPIWSETLTLGSIYEGSRAVSQQVIGKLMELDPILQPPLELSHEPIPAAEELYQLGRLAWSRRGRSDVEQALGYFQRAVQVDPDYARAYAAIANCYSILIDYGMVPAANLRNDAKGAALKARELEPNLAEAHASLGFIISLTDWDWERAGAAFQRAIELEYSLADAHHWYGYYLMNLGDTEGAIREARIALDLNPMSRTVSLFLAWAYYYARRYEDAIRQAEETLRLHPGYRFAHVLLAYSHAHLGRASEALRQVEMAADAAEEEDPGVAARYRATAYAILGMREPARREAETVAELSHGRQLGYLSMIHAYLGETEMALHWAEKAVQARDSSILAIYTDPSYDGLRSNPRYLGLIDRLGLGRSGTLQAAREALETGD